VYVRVIIVPQILFCEIPIYPRHLYSQTTPSIFLAHAGQLGYRPQLLFLPKGESMSMMSIGKLHRKARRISIYGYFELQKGKQYLLPL
jgi:hypothetical protein